MPITRLDKLLKSTESVRLGEIVQNAQEIQSLTGALQATLDAELAGALVAASVKGDELVVLAASPAWASRLRFQAAELVEAARAHGAEVSRARVRVARAPSQA